MLNIAGEFLVGFFQDPPEGLLVINLLDSFWTRWLLGHCKLLPLSYGRIIGRLIPSQPWKSLHFNCSCSLWMCWLDFVRDWSYQNRWREFCRQSERLLYSLITAQIVFIMILSTLWNCLFSSWNSFRMLAD